jgi:hypothetical protein
MARYGLMLADNVLHGLMFVPALLVLITLLSMLRKRSSLLDTGPVGTIDSAASRRRLGVLLLSTFLVVGIPPLFLHPEGVFFTGDGGVKYMQVAGLIDGHFTRFSLDWRASDWVKSIWTKYDAFPIQPPFVHETPAGLFIVYPVAFALLSSLTFLWLGGKGLVIWPLVGALGLCGALWRVWRGDRYVLFKVLGVILCTPIVFYSMLYWEHAVALPFVAAGLLMLPRARSSREFLLCGLILGCSLFFRSEAIAFFPACLLMLLWRKKTFVVWFYAGMVLTAVLYLFLNRYAFGTFMPPHATQMVRNPLFIVLTGIINLSEMLPSLVSIAPCFLLALWAALEADSDDRMILAITTTSIVVIAFIAPAKETSDFGPRYLVTIMPLLGYVAMNVTFRFRKAGIVLLCALLWGFCLWNNFVAANRQQIRQLWSRTYPADQQLRRMDDAQIILTGYPYISQEFGVFLYGRDVILVRDRTFPAILEDMSREGIRSALLVAYPDGRWGSFQYREDSRLPYRSEVVGIYGEYLLVRYTR